jgi:hypothetical protein
MTFFDLQNHYPLIELRYNKRQSFVNQFLTFYFVIIGPQNYKLSVN